MKVPDSPQLNTRKYELLRGVDFSCDATEVARTRTPTGINMISDSGGNPVKRIGWRKCLKIEGEKILDCIFDDPEAIIITDKGIYTKSIETLGDNAPPVSVFNLINDSIKKVNVVPFKGNRYFFIKNNDKFTIYEKIKNTMKCVFSDGDSLGDLGDFKEPYIPEVTISLNPDGTAGKSLEAVNLLSSKKTFSFLGDSSATEFWLYQASVRGQNQYKYIVKDSLKVEVRTINGWEKTTDFTTTGDTTQTGYNLTKKVQKTFNVCSPMVKFTSPKPPLVAGQDNVRITFEAFNAEPEGTGCKGLGKDHIMEVLDVNAFKIYGYGNSDRVFVGGNTNKVYYSGVNQPLYFPDTNYMLVGNDDNGIVGFHQKAGYLVAIKDNSSDDNTVFMIDGGTWDDDTFFRAKATSAKVGAVSKETFDTLSDEPLFLTTEGICAISNHYLGTETIIRARSTHIDKKLLGEKNLDTACACSWRKYYLLAVNGNCYVLDGRRRISDRKDNTDFSYEAYFFENIPARKFFVHKNELYFADDMGILCKANTDIIDNTKYSDNGEVSMSADGGKVITGGTAISCEWSTPLDDDNSPQYFKTLNKKGCLVTIIPHDQTSAKVTLIADGDREYPLGVFYGDINSWENIDFSRFSFNSNETAFDSFIRKKVRKYKRLQIVISNDALYEPFGILQIVKTYRYNNFSKNRG